MTPEEIVQKLRKNGGPLALAAADCIEALLSQLPAQKPRGGLHPHHRSLILLCQQRLNKETRPSAEMRAFRQIRDDITDQDLFFLCRFYRQPEPKHFDKFLSSRKKTPLTLMRDYQHQVDLAAEWCRLNPPPPDPKQTKYPEPNGWQAHAPGRLAEYSWHLLCQQYPDIAKQIHDQLKS